MIFTHFEILSLSGFFIPTEYYGTKSTVCGVSFSLADRDGRVMGVTLNIAFAKGVFENFRKT